MSSTVVRFEGPGKEVESVCVWGGGGGGGGGVSRVCSL
jgi:hypothetical protein